VKRERSTRGGSEGYPGAVNTLLLGGITQIKKTIDFRKMKRDNGFTVSCKKSLFGSQRVTKGLLILLWPFFV